MRRTSSGVTDVDGVEAAVSAARQRVSQQEGPSGQTRVVLVLDQFESAFQLGSAEAERSLLERLTDWATADGDVTTVLTMRADYYADAPVHMRPGRDSSLRISRAQTCV
jgi:KaiC/GvpD/RAD55 family RecA-like ATPase